MNSDDRQKVAAAIDALDIVDIALFDCHLKRFEDVPATPELDLVQMWKRTVSCRRDENSDFGKVFLAKIDLGVRLGAPPPKEGDDPIIYAEIEASYVALYRIKHETDEQNLKLFAENNSVHNVWPFWRQFVFDIVQKSKLPHIEVPLIAGIPKNEAQH